MHLTVFGATGRTGRPLVAQALAAGHHVTALVRTPAKLDLAHPNLTVVQGDVTDAEAVARVVDGADAVLSALGPVKGGPASMLTQATRNVIAAMRQHGVQRVVIVSGAGVPDPLDPRTGPRAPSEA